MTQEHVPVVVIGAGPTGASAAIMLGQRGIRCLVLERWPEVYPLPRAVHFDDEVFRIFASMGLADEVAAISRPLPGHAAHRPRAPGAGRDHPGSPPNYGYPQANMFDQPELEQVLRTALTELPVGRVARRRRRGRDRRGGRRAGPGAGALPRRRPGHRRRYRPGAGGVGRLRARRRRGEQPHPGGRRSDHGGPRLRAAVAGRRRGQPRAAAGLRRGPAGLRPRPRRHLHAGRARPLPVGVPAAPRRAARGLRPRQGPRADPAVAVRGGRRTS